MFKIKGLTLIELMVVFIIIALLAMFALPKYREYSIKAKVGQAVEAINTINNELIQQYNDGLWDCNANSFNFNGTNYTVSNSSSSPISDFPGVLETIQLQKGLNSYACGVNNTIAVLQYGVVNQGLIICIIQDKSGVAYKRCGVWDGTTSGELQASRLPPGYDCLLTGNQTFRGTICPGFAHP